MKVPEEPKIIITGESGMGMSMMAHKVEEQMEYGWFNQ